MKKILILSLLLIHGCDRVSFIKNHDCGGIISTSSAYSDLSALNSTESNPTLAASYINKCGADTEIKPHIENILNAGKAPSFELFENTDHQEIEQASLAAALGRHVRYGTIAIINDYETSLNLHKYFKLTKKKERFLHLTGHTPDDPSTYQKETDPLYLILSYQQKIFNPISLLKNRSEISGTISVSKYLGTPTKNLDDIGKGLNALDFETKKLNEKQEELLESSPSTRTRVYIKAKLNGLMSSYSGEGYHQYEGVLNGNARPSPCIIISESAEIIKSTGYHELMLEQFGVQPYIDDNGFEREAKILKIDSQYETKSSERLKISRRQAEIWKEITLASNSLAHELEILKSKISVVHQ